MNVKNSKIPLIVVIILLLILLSTYIWSFYNNAKTKNEENSLVNMTESEKEELIDNTINDSRIVLLQSYSERDRIEYYIKEFFECLSNENYSKAYEMLNEDFRKNYYSTLEKFEEYTKNNIPSNPSLEFTNIQRMGETYIEWVNVKSIFSSKNDAAIEMNVVVKENDVNDFELSFSIK